MKELRSDLRDKILNMELLPNQAALFYIGQVGFIIKYQNTYTMIDGYLSDYVDKNCSSDLVRWERLYPAPIQAENLDFLDFIFCTHAHFDHADPWTLRKIAEVNHRSANKEIEAALEKYVIAFEREHGEIKNEEP